MLEVDARADARRVVVEDIGKNCHRRRFEPGEYSRSRQHLEIAAPQCGSSVRSRDVELSDGRHPYPLVAHGTTLERRGRIGTRPVQRR